MRKRASGIKPRERELVALCRGCLAFETLWFKGDRMYPTRRFSQGSDQRIYHDCGTDRACRLFHTLTKERGYG